MTTTTDTAPLPEVRIYRRADGWTLPALSPDVQACTSNYIPERADMPPCSARAVWKVVELHDMHATIGFWCDNHLPAEHRQAAPSADA